MRRIAHLTTVDSSLRYLLMPQLRAALEHGDEVIGISAPGPDVAMLERNGIRHLPLRSSTRGMDLRADLRAALELWKLLRDEQIDVLHTHNPKPGLYGRVVGRLAGVPTVVNTNHGLWATDHDRWAKRVVVLGLERIASFFSDAELVQNSEDLDLLTSRRIYSRRKTILLGNGVDLERFHPSRVPPDARTTIRDKLGIAPDAVVFGAVGRLVAEKGYPELFDAFEQLEGHELIVIGPSDPEKADALDDRVVQRATAAGVHFLGHRDDVERYYAAMDVFVLPSHREGFPRAAMEAASMRLPIITTDVRGCRQVVDHDGNGLIVPVRDPARLADAMQRLGSDPARRAEMGAAGRRKAEREFDERRVVDLVMNVYDEPPRRQRLPRQRVVAHQQQSA
jgi:glycosyltransferase involved in cell wall biosynthesis